MTELVTNSKARAAVLAFLAQTDPPGAAKSFDDVGEQPAFKLRPSRLAIGATFVERSSTHGNTEAERRLRGALRKEHAGNEQSDDGGGELSSDLEVESRSKVIGKRGKRKRRRSKAKTEETEGKFGDKKKEATKNGGDVKSGDAASRVDIEDSMETDALGAYGVKNTLDGAKCDELSEDESPKLWDVPNDTIATANGGLVFEPDAETKAKAQEVAPSVETALHIGEKRGEEKSKSQASLQANGGVWKRRKKKKIRSRQKNLRRDKRPKESLPPHLTEETLRSGRLPPRYSRQVAEPASS